MRKSQAHMQCGKRPAVRLGHMWPLGKGTARFRVCTAQLWTFIAHYVNGRMQ